MTKEERLKAAEAYAADRIWINKDNPDNNDHLFNEYISKGSFIAGAEAEAESNQLYVSYTTFLIASVNELLKAEKSIVKDGYVKLTIDEDYTCSDADLAKYKIEYKYPLHLIHLGNDLHIASLNLSDDLKRKWFIR